MATIELRLPKMGESVAEASILSWLKKEGDRVTADEPLVEIATDKVNSEVPSPEDGILVSCRVNVGDTVQVGHVIAIIETGDGASAPAPVAASIPAAAEVAVAPSAPVAAPLGTAVVSSSDRFYSPLVKNIAKQENITQAELDSISGTGQNGRVTKEDLMGYISNRGNNAVSAPEVSAAQAPVAASVPAVEAPRVKGPTITVGPNDEIVEMDRMRRIIADHMVMSTQVSPHVTSYVEADLTNVVMWRNKVKKQFEANAKTKLTFTPIFIEAVAKAIRDFPGVNASVDGNNIIMRGDINIGMAAALPSGNLIVPVIKNADQLNLMGIAKKVNDLAERARANKLTPDEIQGGTYTLTNVGSFGNVMGTPIINQPQVAILAVGAIRKKPAVIETPQGDAIAIRHMMFLSHSYDHRIVDGALGGRFVRRVADYLEEWDVNREI
ncbi:MAG: 2-oxo acid dehydrogenase subunit E2 [Flavobacteriales bacterium]|nr:2-oxo acid dehydrogenase subunit E2 [Flavobacteriales bacterium]MDP4716440.1 2-oxo acid dehydrogenase subunit E2 [Flavobacteriales bacterium]MDP4730592.1 2-oxo acid dehydrogenase subunit E2 [Flavobacteriales bacterium]MDP4817934.1 2-oxo acid dehydrogenase subunit E2 [Flavobacteriales bacterium]MDP4950987.1 2-oxo acid dehydrogenase subunit E2 [Flavobacteriales bacterium]